MESKHDKFVRLAERRVNRAVSAIRSISKLSNSNHYNFSELEVKKLLLAIRKEVDAMQSTFNLSLAGKQKNRFQFTTKSEEDK